MKLYLNNVPFEVEDYFEKFEEEIDGTAKGYAVLLNDDLCVKQTAYKENGMVYFDDAPGKLYERKQTKEANSTNANNDGFTKDKILSMFQSYVANDAEAAGLDYIQEALELAGCSKEDAEKIGLGWAWPDD